MVQLSTPVIDPERHSAQPYRQTDRQTERQQYHANSRPYCAQQYDRLKADSYECLLLLLLERYAHNVPKMSI